MNGHRLRMAKSPRKPRHAATHAVAEPTPAGDTPAPPEHLHISTLIWKAVRTLHRVHLAEFAGDQFNPGKTGNARFSPIKTPRGKSIPTVYGGSTFECAAMETVFHDVPFVPGFKSSDKAKLKDQVHTRLTFRTDLVLVDLRSKALRKLGIQRKHLIDSEKDQYPVARLWAEAIHTQHPHVQGLCWTSRQDDAAQAVVLFGDRIAPGDLYKVGDSRSLLDDSATYDELLDLALQVGVNIVPGKT
jgi:hypothetical protein